MDRRVRPDQMAPQNYCLNTRYFQHFFAIFKEKTNTSIQHNQMAPRFYTLKTNGPSFLKPNGPPSICKNQMAPHFLVKTKWPPIFL